MSNIKILDCTLRDGGYVNNFEFGQNTIRQIIRKLADASLDIIECGFLKSGEKNVDRTLFPNIKSIRTAIGNKKPGVSYVAMIQYGKIDNEEIQEYDEQSVDGIRITFHEHEIAGALELGEQLAEKGYKVFMQPVGTMTYTDSSLLALIEQINRLKPYAFYMVDTLGTMYKKDLLRMFFLIDHNLDPEIVVGFHSHNNLQLAFSNAQELMQLNTKRQFIIDASVYGMGRGAGNLCTELITQYLNDNMGSEYNNMEIIEIIDRYIRPLRRQYDWGYDVVYYIASVNGCHPNYSRYLLDLQTLHVQDIHAILSNMDIQERTLYNHAYIEQEYLRYMSHYRKDDDVVERFRKKAGGKPILLIAPGKSIKNNWQEIRKMAQSGDYFVISINFIPEKIPVQLIFVSNMKRFDNLIGLNEALYDGCEAIITSNISLERYNDKISIINYAGYLNEEPCIVDNAGLMCINFLKKAGVKEVLMAGFDGFSKQIADNYYESSMVADVGQERIDQMNKALSKKINQLQKQMRITFMSESMYQEGIACHEI